MKINIFEGARRITKLITVLSIIVFLLFVSFEFKSSPYIKIAYKISTPDILPTKAPDCDSCIFCEPMKIKTKNNTRVNVDLCFEPSYFKKVNRFNTTPLDDLPDNIVPLDDLPDDIVHTGSSFIITTPEGKKYSVKGPYGATKEEALKQAQAYAQKKHIDPLSSDFDHGYYTQKYAKSFELPSSDEQWADEKKWSNRWDNIYGYTGVLAGWMAILWIFSWSLGWIVRGFLGIPTGQDQKSNTDST